MQSTRRDALVEPSRTATVLQRALPRSHSVRIGVLVCGYDRRRDAEQLTSVPKPGQVTPLDHVANVGAGASPPLSQRLRRVDVGVGAAMGGKQQQQAIIRSRQPALVPNWPAIDQKLNSNERSILRRL